MSLFTGPLTLIELDKNWRLWQLASVLVYEIGFEGSGNAVNVPIGYITDGATIPRIFWWLIPTWGKYSRAAVLHDYMCDLVLEGNPHPYAKNIKQCDLIFLEAMGVLKVSVFIKYAMYLTIRLAYFLKLRKSAVLGL